MKNNRIKRQITIKLNDCRGVKNKKNPKDETIKKIKNDITLSNKEIDNPFASGILSFLRKKANENSPILLGNNNPKTQDKE